jgi:hypothetical protein
MTFSYNPFVGLPIATLLATQQTWLQVLNDIALAGQSYTFPNRSITKADLPMVLEILGLVQYAIDDAYDYGPSGRGAPSVAYAVIDTQSRFAA